MVWISWHLFLCICQFCSFFQCSSSKEAIIKNGRMSMWFKNSFTLQGIGAQWTKPDVTGGDSTSTCGSRQESIFWFITKHISVNHSLAHIFYVDVEAHFKSLCEGRKPCFSNAFELYVYRGEEEPAIPSVSAGGRNNAKMYIEKHFSFIGNITNSTAFKQPSGAVKQTFILHRNKTDGITFAGKSRGACGTIHRMKMYYYYCEESFVESIKLEKTISPANGSKQVLGTCSNNSERSPKDASSIGYCHRNGTWRINDQSKCLCLGGYEPSTNGCLRCSSDSYKAATKNVECSKCLSNSISTNEATSCRCKEGYYKPSVAQTSSVSPCYGLVKITETPTITKLDDASINITWSKPTDNGGINETIFYDVQCFVCLKTVCNDSCWKANYSPSQYNLTETYVVVSNLKLGETYIFKIYPRNSLNQDFNKKKWEFKETEHLLLGSSEVKRRTSDSNYTTILVIVVSIATVILLLSTLIGIYWNWRKNQEKEQTTFPVELESMHDREINPIYAEVDPPRANDIPSILSLFQDVQRSDESFWEFPRKRLTILRKLGEGSFGTVNKAKWTPIHAITSEKGGIVAVKMLKENASLKDERDFMSELNLMKKLEPHPHVVQLLGCCTNSEPFFLILEYLVGGDLLGYLRKSRGYKDPYNTGEYVPTSRLREKDLLSFAYMISDGMNYLSSKGIVHRDLSARNVLVGEDNICKVSDFGLAREGTYVRKSKARLPAKWMAPEDLLLGQCTSMSDIWSYGILLWEIFTIGDSPYPGVKGEDVFHLIECGFRMPKPSHFSDKLYSLMMDCWNDEPMKRPKFSYISSVFHKMLEDFTAKAYLDLTKFDDYHYENFDVISAQESAS